MKQVALFAAACAICLPVMAKPCEELKSEIAAKIDAKGVTGYSLDIVANEQAADKKVVGSCDGGTKKIVYKRK